MNATCHDHFDLQVIFDPVLAPLATYTGMFETAESRDQRELVIAGAHSRMGNTHGVAAFDTTPVFIATIPNCSNSETLDARFRFSVNKYDASPTSQSLAMEITSSSVSNWKIGAIGPKISSRHTRISLCTLLRIVGSKKLGPRLKLDIFWRTDEPEYSLRTYQGLVVSCHPSQ